MKLLLIADENNAIAAHGDQIVYLSKDLDHFKETSWGQVVFMGRVTYEKIGRALPGRINIVYTSRNLERPDNLYTVSSHEEFTRLLEDFPDKEVYLIGGEKLTQLYLDCLQEALITRVHHKFKGGDQFAPDFASLPHWSLKTLSSPIKDGNFTFQIEHWIKEDPRSW